MKIFWTCAFLNFSLSYLLSSSWILSYHILSYDKIFIYYITSPSNEMHKFKIFSKLCALQSSVQRTILKIFWTCAFLNFSLSSIFIIFSYLILSYLILSYLPPTKCTSSKYFQNCAPYSQVYSAQFWKYFELVHFLTGPDVTLGALMQYLL